MVEGIITILFTSPLPVALVLIGTLCVAIAIIGKIPSLNIEGGRALVLAIFGLFLIFLAIMVAWLLASITSKENVTIPTDTALVELNPTEINTFPDATSTSQVKLSSTDSDFHEPTVTQSPVYLITSTPQSFFTVSDAEQIELRDDCGYSVPEYSIISYSDKTGISSEMTWDLTELQAGIVIGNAVEAIIDGTNLKPSGSSGVTFYINIVDPQERKLLWLKDGQFFIVPPENADGWLRLRERYMECKGKIRDTVSYPFLDDTDVSTDNEPTLSPTEKLEYDPTCNWALDWELQSDGSYLWVGLPPGSTSCQNIGQEGELLQKLRSGENIKLVVEVGEIPVGIDICQGQYTATTVVSQGQKCVPNNPSLWPQVTGTVIVTGSDGFVIGTGK